jgi:hypothetical protein
LIPPITVDWQPGGRDGTIVPIGKVDAACAAAAAADACAAAAWAAAALAAAAFAAAAFIAAASVTATVEATTAPRYIERRATPATDSGVRGIPMIAWASLTSRIPNWERDKNSGIETSIPSDNAINSHKRFIG